jgi:RNA polymerase sigma factor (sigma-70 family)
VKDFRIIAKIYNNQLRERREATGMSQSAFARSIGLHIAEYCGLETMRRSPLTNRVKKRKVRTAERPKKWSHAAVVVAGALGVEPGTLWPDAVLEIEKTSSEVRIDASDIAAMLPPAESNPFLLLSSGEETQALAQAIEALTEKERSVIGRHYYNGETLDAIGKDLGVTRERARQIECGAIRKLRKQMPEHVINNNGVD